MILSITTSFDLAGADVVLSIWRETGLVMLVLEVDVCPILSLFVDFDKSGVRFTAATLTLVLRLEEMDPDAVDPVVVLRRC